MKVFAVGGLSLMLYASPIWSPQFSEGVSSPGRAILTDDERQASVYLLAYEWVFTILMFLFHVILALCCGYWVTSFDALASSDSKAFLMAQFERQMGKEDLLKDESDAILRQHHFRKALRYMGVPIPQTTFGLCLTLFLQFLRQATHWVPFGTAVDHWFTLTFHNEAAVTEVANNYFMLSQEFFSNSKFPLEGWVCLFRALNLSEVLGPSPLLVNVYSSLAFQIATRLPSLCIVFSGLLPYFWKMGIVTERNASLGKKSIGWTSLLDAWGKTAYGELDTAAQKFEVVSKICIEAGWPSMAWQAKIFKCAIECIRGDLRCAERTLKDIKDTTELSKHSPCFFARSRKIKIHFSFLFFFPSESPALTYWTLIVELGISVMKDETMEESVALMARMSKLRQEWKPKGTRWFNTVSVLDTITRSVHCIVLYRNGDPTAVDQAERCVVESRDTPYIIFSGTHLCLKLLCEATLGIWRDIQAGGKAAEPWKDINVDRLKRILKESISILKKLSTLYVVAEATHLYYSGVQARLEGDRPRAVNFLERGLVVSRKLNLKLEEALCMLELCLAEDQPKLEKLLHACDLIEATGWMHHYRIARGYLSPHYVTV